MMIFFFNKALLYEGTDVKINQLVKQFIAYERADGLYINSKTTALAHAVFELAKVDEKYAETAKYYFFIIDLEHDASTRRCWCQPCVSFIPTIITSGQWICFRGNIMAVIRVNKDMK